MLTEKLVRDFRKQTDFFSYERTTYQLKHLKKKKTPWKWWSKNGLNGMIRNIIYHHAWNGFESFLISYPRNIVQILWLKKLRLCSDFWKISFEAPGWLSQLGIRLWVRSRSHSLLVWALCQALCWQLRFWSLLQILCLRLSLLLLPCSCSVSLSLSQK